MLKNFKKFFYEIKNRTMLIVVGCLFTFQVFYFNKENFLFFLAQPLLQGNNDPKINYFMFQNVSEIFSLYFDILFFATSQVFSFAFSFHAAAFALPASKPIEQARFKKFTRNTLSFWLLMVHITAAHLVPSTTFFFLKLSDNYNLFSNFDLLFEPNIFSYWIFCKSMYVSTSLTVVLCFVLFCFLICFNPHFFKQGAQKYRKTAYYLFFFFSTILSPPDVFSQLCLVIALTVGLETAIFFLSTEQKCKEPNSLKSIKKKGTP